MAAPPSGRRPDSGSFMLDSIDSYTNPAHRARSRCLSQVGHGLVTGGSVTRVRFKNTKPSGKVLQRFYSVCVCVCFNYSYSLGVTWL